MNRADLEALDRDTLIARAERAGVTRARILTRAELVDELLLRSAPDDATRRRTRGLFGMARDLVARVVERGLHLPDAAERIRTIELPVPPRGSAPAALPTVTLAEIYAAQGHRDRAIETLESVLQREPEHAVARALLVQLRDASYLVPAPKLPPEPEDLGAAPGAEPEPAGSSALSADAELQEDEPRPDDGEPPEPFGMLDDRPLPTRYDVDECVAIPVDPQTVYVYWETRDATLDAFRASRADGALTLRLVIVVPTWDGPRLASRDVPVSAQIGDCFVRDLPQGCVVRAAIGWKAGDEFSPLAHSPALETPPGAPSPIVAEGLVRWTPSGSLPVHSGDADAAIIERALGRARREAILALGPDSRRPPGSSEFRAASYP